MPKRTLKGKILAILTLTILVGVGGLLITMFIQHGHLLSVQSGSMVPAFRKGDLVNIKRVPDYHVGDVVTFINPENNKTTVTHRIVALADPASGNDFITKGDANPLPDEPIDKIQIVGKVTRKIPYAGHVLDFIRKPLGLILLIYIPALLVVISELRRLAGYYKSLQPYLAPGQRDRLLGLRKTPAVIKTLPLLLAVIPVFLVVNAQAAFQSTAMLTGNTISTAAMPPTEPPKEGGCTNTNNNTNVDVHSSSRQRATTGSASVSNNQTSGSATSGSATNTKSTNITVSVDNC